MNKKSWMTTSWVYKSCKLSQYVIYCLKAVFLNWRAVTYHPKSQLQSLEKVLIVNWVRGRGLLKLIIEATNADKHPTMTKRVIC